MCGHPECGQRSPKCRLLLVLSPTLIRTDSVFKREVATLAGFGDIQLERLSNLLVQPDCVLFFKSNQYVPIAVENGNFAGLRITFRRQPPNLAVCTDTAENNDRPTLAKGLEQAGAGLA